MDPRLLQLLQRLRLSNVAVSGTLRSNLDQALARRWQSMDSWRDADMAKLMKDVLPLVNAAERQMVDLTVAYLASVESATAGQPFRPARPRYQELTGTALRGTEPRDVFMRPQMVVNWRVSKGDSVARAAAAGETRLRSLAATNLQLAKRNTVAAHGQARFYRRVLTGRENCALCVIASTQRYRRGQLAPIHPGCDCGIEEIVDGQPGQVIDPVLLETTHTEIAARLGGTDRSAFDLGLDKRDVAGRPLSDFTELIVIRQHGELGPTLAWRSDHFRDAAEAAALAP